MRQIDFFVVMIANQFDGIFQRRHHAQSEQIDFDDAHVGAVFFIPLHDDAARHGRRLQRHNGIETSLADDHAARVLPEMPRQILHRETQLEIFANARMREIEPGIAQTAIERVILVPEFPGGHRGRNSLQRVLVEAHRPCPFRAPPCDCDK